MSLKKLCDVSKGKKGKIAGILKYKTECECMGLYPDMQVEVLTIDPLKGPCVIKTENDPRDIVLKREIAAHINVDTD